MSQIYLLVKKEQESKIAINITMGHFFTELAAPKRWLMTNISALNKLHRSKLRSNKPMLAYLQKQWVAIISQKGQKLVTVKTFSIKND